ncbi:MAG: hypothetical protein WD738_10840 [Pirellulales bacterium]
MPHRLRLAASLFLLTVSPTAALAQPFPVTIGQNFEGTARLIQPIPPDTMGAAGIDYFVELNNDEFNVYRKSDGVQVQSKGINQFWIDAGTSPSTTPFDPRIVYDPHARRWYAVSADRRQAANNILFAVSSSSDPTQPWTGFSIDTDPDDSHWADFPMLGYTGDGVFISGVMVPVVSGPRLTSFVTLPKFDLLQPSPTIAGMTQIYDIQQVTSGDVPQMAIDASNTFGTEMRMLSMFDQGGGEVVRSRVALGGTTVANYGYVGAPAADPPSADQPGAVQNLEANDWRFSSNTVNLNGELYGVQAIDNAGIAAVRYWRLDALTNSVVESQVIADPLSRALIFPSIAVNEFGDVVIGFSASSATEFASSYAMVGKVAGLTTTFDPPMLLKAGVDNYVRLDSLGRNRWGDYSATTVDPADPSIFWTNQEFVVNTNRWATQVTELIVPRPNDARWADPVGGNFDDPTMWQTQHGGLPQSTDDVIFSRATDLSGTSIPVLFPPQPAGFYASNSASIRQGNVLLDLNGNQWDLTRQLDVGPFYANPQVTIANGSVSSTAGFIADRPTAEGHLILDNAHWTVSGHLTVGSAPAPGSGGVPIVPGFAGGTGVLIIDNNSRVDVLDNPQAGSLGLLTIWERGEVNLFDGVLRATVIEQPAPPGPGSGLNFTGGTLHVDTFSGELHNNGGTLAPGGSIGTTNVLLSYFQGAGSSLAIEIGGTGPGQFDQLIVGGLADFGGTLDVSLFGGFLPSLSDTFGIVQAAVIPIGGYASLLANSFFPTISTRLDWHLFYQPTLLTLAVVPALTGDFNADGTVNAADYVIWRSLSGRMGIGLAADSNFDGVVNLVDYFMWRSHFGQMVPGAGSGSAADRPPGAVPEPASGLIMVVAALLFAPTLARQPRNEERGARIEERDDY